ncbi:MAG: cation-translocating P-type ATPase [Trueperaceae bacterium]|nr:cation-translocating P-type ATPase [Trueperaceae bacterium]
MRFTRTEIPVLVSAALIAASLGLAATGPADGAAAAWVRDGLMLVAALVAGAGIAARAVRALLRRDVSIEVLVTVATVGAIAIGELWEAAAVTFLFTLGHALEARTLRSTRAAIGSLLALLPTEVRVLRDGVEHTVAPHQVGRGDVVVVRPGERIPVDGRVVGGHAGVDESTLTGESIPVDKGPGDEALTGTTAHGYLEIETAAVGADTTLAQVVRLVEEAQEAKPARQRFLERFARVYTPAVIVGAAVAYLVTNDVHLALTLLVIACPGALVIATPVAMVTGIGRAAKDGVLFKGGEPLELLARVRTVAFDKTGTLTRGRPILHEVVTPDAGRYELHAGTAPATALPADVRSAVALAARAEAGSEHPIATAIRDAAARLSRDASADAPRPEAFEAVAGGGARARIDGRRVLIGSPAFLAHEGVDLPAGMTAAAALQDRGRTVSGLAVDGTLRAWLGLGDETRPGAREALAGLRRHGVRWLAMLTGDHARSAEAVARELGIDAVHAELRPGDKSDAITELASGRGPVAMVGDGVNDAPALARADVGIAMGAAGTRAALETATVALMGDDLRALPHAMGLARRTVRVVRQNLAIALGTVALLVAGVLAGSVHMAGGMLIHQLSVLLVILNALRLARPVRRTPAARRSVGGGRRVGPRIEPDAQAAA